MKTLLCVIALVGILAMPILAEEVKMDLSGRLATGWFDNGKTSTNPGSFNVPDLKINADMKLDADTAASVRLNFDNGVANGADIAYIKVDNVMKKLGVPEMVNPSITVGIFKTNFGEETWSNNMIDGPLVYNSQADVSGQDAGIQFKQDDIVKGLPMVLCASFAVLNGCGTPDNNNTKAHTEKVSATFNNMPLYLSLSNYGSGDMPAGSTSALNVGGANFCPVGWNRKVVELDARWDLLEGAQKFDPSKAPLFGDVKGIFKLAFGQGSDSNGAASTRFNFGYVALEGIYNVNNKWYAAFRYSYLQDKDNTTNKMTRISIGGGHKLGENTALKAEYTQNQEPTASKIDNDYVSLVLTAKW